MTTYNDETQSWISGFVDLIQKIQFSWQREILLQQSKNIYFTSWPEMTSLATSVRAAINSLAHVIRVAGSDSSRHNTDDECQIVEAAKTF